MECVFQASFGRSSYGLKDILKDFEDVFSGIGKLKDFQMKLHIKDDINVPIR